MNDKSKDFISGYDYACGVLLREDSTLEEIEALSSEHTTDFDLGVIQAVNKLESLGVLKSKSSDSVMNGFEKREQLGSAYWDDPSWKKVRELRDKGCHSEANGLVCRIRSKWGL